MNGVTWRAGTALNLPVGFSNALSHFSAGGYYTAGLDTHAPVSYRRRRRKYQVGHIHTIPASNRAGTCAIDKMHVCMLSRACERDAMERMHIRTVPSRGAPEMSHLPTF